MGTDAWRNWNAYIEGQPETENVDFEVFSDRQVTAGPACLGPYLLSIVLGSNHGIQRPAMRTSIKLRMSVHTKLMPDLVIDGRLVAANSDAYHGGDASDEIVALLSLELGIRLRVAGTSRLSGIHEVGAESTPIYLEVTPLATPGTRGQEFIPATMDRPANLESVRRLASFPTLNEQSQVELVRAARAYSAALWWSNEDPNQAWLNLVTAVEIAANYRQKEEGAPVDLVQSYWPELWTALSDASDEVRHRVSKQVAPQMRATRKFVNFVTLLAPEPPAGRPPYDKLDWSEMASHARLIYAHRSRALHSGKPFPLPMLEAARRDDDGLIQEVPAGLSTGGQGGVWMAAEAPMLLSTFEHIVRGTLLKWWDELQTSKPALA